MASGLMNFADGGRPPTNKLSIVGEEGPELFVPDTAGTIIPNDAFEETRNALLGGDSTDSFSENEEALSAIGNSVTNNYGSTGSSSSFAENNSVLSASNSLMRENAYRREEQSTLERSMERDRQTVLAGNGSMVIETQVINNVEYATVEQVQKTAALSAKQARAQVFSDLKNKPATRAQIGMR